MSKRTWNKKYTKKKTSSQLIDEKIALLDREMRKTNLGEAIANSTSGLYQQGDTVTTPPVLNGWNNTFPDAPEGPTTSGGGSAKLSASGSFTADDFTLIRRNYPQYTKNNGVYPYTSTGYWSWVWVSPNLAADWGNLTNSFGEKFGVTPGGRYISGYYTSLGAIDTRLIAGGSRIHVSDPDVGYRVSYWPNNYPATIPVSGARAIDDPNFLPVLSRTRGNIKGTDSWEKVKDMLDAGKEWMDMVIGDINPIDAAFRVFENVAKSYGLYGAANTLREYGNFTSGRVSYTLEKPKMTDSSSEERREILKVADSQLFMANLEPGTKHYKPPVTEKEKQRARKIIGESLATAINSAKGNLYYQHGAVSPTFHKGLSNKEGISPDGKGGLNINDGYDFAPKEGQTGTENARVPGPAGYVLEMLANAVTYDARNKEYEKKGKGYGSVADLPRMPIRTTFTKEDLKGTSLGQLLDDIGFDKSLKEDKTLKRVSAAIKNPSPITETKTIQTEQKSPSRFLKKPRIKSVMELIDEKIAQLEKDLKKTGMGA